MKLRYFAWVRERAGISEEDVALPDDVATVGELIAWLKTRGPEFESAFEAGEAIRAAVDLSHADHSAPVAGAREIAFFPTGHRRLSAMIRVQEQDFDIAAEIAALGDGNGGVGAVVTFTGLVRGDDALTAMTLEHYPGMTEKALEEIEAEAHARWPLEASLIVHRVGRLVPGDNIVLVVTASAHRQAAFEAANFLMDYLKTEAPFWKLEERGEEKRWVEARDSDGVAKERWEKDAAE